ncbi:hypothetical protein C823_000700 [Eubacterium plexicaudatum ASF492]|uniref:Uncharacterized protein n=1 Tax=Eubacterium plexicaudatum ASF492 TaxID=1235802 RepID=N2A8D3_9FIRM|nr:hypothetical protein C823_000700 [Eubacterium plexicaudatum ASF492]
MILTNVKYNKNKIVEAVNIFKAASFWCVSSMAL